MTMTQTWTESITISSFIEEEKQEEANNQRDEERDDDHMVKVDKSHVPTDCCIGSAEREKKKRLNYVNKIFQDPRKSEISSPPFLNRGSQASAIPHSLVYFFVSSVSTTVTFLTTRFETRFAPSRSLHFTMSRSGQDSKKPRLIPSKGQKRGSAGNADEKEREEMAFDAQAPVTINIHFENSILNQDGQIICHTGTNNGNLAEGASFYTTGKNKDDDGGDSREHRQPKSNCPESVSCHLMYN